MKILCLIDSLGSGGAQRQLATLSGALKNRGHEIRFVTYRPADHFLPLLQEAGIACESVPPRSYPRRALAIRRTLRQDWQDVVLSFLEAPNLYALLAAIPSRSWGLVLGERSAHPHLATGRKSWIRQLYRLADAVICNSHTNRLMLETSFPFLQGRVCTIYNTVDFALFSPAAAGPPVASRRRDSLRILVAASYQENKNMLNVARALALLRDREQGAPVSLDWFGDTPADSSALRRVESLVQDEDLQASMELHPPTADIGAEYARSDAVGLFSFYEGLSNSVCEAMASAKPILLSNVSDASNLVHDGRNGLLCDPASPQDIAQKMMALASLTQDQRRAMGMESRRMAESLFAEGAVVEHYEQVLAAAARREVLRDPCHWPVDVPVSALQTVQRWTDAPRGWGRA